MNVITKPEQVTTEWLTAILRKAGVLPRGAVQTVISTPVGSNLQMRLTFTEASDAPTRLFLKLAQRDLEFGIEGIGSKEVTFYNAIASSMDKLPVVRCYDAVYEGGCSHILLEDLSETHIAHPPAQIAPPEAHCAMMVDALAQLHAYWWDDARLGNGVGTCPSAQSIQEMLDEVASFYPSFVDYLGDRLPAKRCAIYERAFASAAPVYIRRVTSKHITMIFEDVHIGNFLYPRDPSKDRLRMIDWEQWGIRIGAHDLAYMMALFWFPERRARLEIPLLKRYYERLLAGGVQGYTWDDLWYDYRLSVIAHLFNPIWQQHYAGERMVDVWWNHLERIFLAYEDLHCSELLA
jgi:hypothetical protein